VPLVGGHVRRAAPLGVGIPAFGQEQPPVDRAGGLVGGGVTDTPTWQLATFPSAPQYCGATPTDQRPNLGKAVSSITHATGPMAAVTRWASRRRTGTGSQGDWLTNCCSACSSAYASAWGSPRASRDE
jgi:hypothetical protein